MERTMVRNTSIAVFALVGCILAATTANAHPKLVKSDPAADTIAAAFPKELRLSFNEDLVPKFSGVEVKDQKGQKVEIGTTAIDPADKKQLVVPFPKPLAEGVYKVDWHAVGADTHRVQGSYSFTVKP
jgi:methionine-rich copper-binding protein CopC